MIITIESFETKLAAYYGTLDNGSNLEYFIIFKVRRFQKIHSTELLQFTYKIV